MKRKMVAIILSKREKFFRSARGTGAMLLGTAALVLSFTAAFFLTGLLYQRTGLHPPAWLVQVINSLLGLFLVGIGAYIAGKVAQKRHQHNDPRTSIFSLLMEAMAEIAKGNFRVRIDPDNPNIKSFQGIFGDLIGSVNNMALELEQMETLRQEFISDVSHEIQSPLTSIRGFAQALQNEDLTPEARAHYLSIIENESTRLSRITENLLRLAALDSDKARFEPRPYCLDKQIRGLILACEPQWTAKSLDLEVALDETTLTADEDLLSQVWINLIHNSIKFTPPGGKICLSLHPGPQTVEFRISDSGAGIPAEDLPRVFERFYKADKSRTGANGGSGLGLSIAKKIVEMHHGSIRVESPPGAETTHVVPTHVGTTFIVQLPA